MLKHWLPELGRHKGQEKMFFPEYPAALNSAETWSFSEKPRKNGLHSAKLTCLFTREGLSQPRTWKKWHELSEEGARLLPVPRYVEPRRRAGMLGSLCWFSNDAGPRPASLIMGCLNLWELDRVPTGLEPDKRQDLPLSSLISLSTLRIPHCQTDQPKNNEEFENEPWLLFSSHNS